VRIQLGLVDKPQNCASLAVARVREKAKAKAKKEDNANVMRIKGNNEFKRKDYSTALLHYMDALKVLPYEVKTLTNIGQAYIKMGMLEDAEEFLTRVLFLDASHVKALSRFAHILSETKRYDDALIKINKAVSLDPSNSDLIKQQRELFAITEQSKLELRVAGLAQKAEESMKTKVAQINELSPAARFTPTLASTATSTTGTARPQTAPAAAGAAAAGAGAAGAAGAAAAGSQEGFDPMDIQKMAALLETLGKGKTEGASEGSDFYTFQLLLKSLVGGRFVAEMPIPPSGADPAGMPPQPPCTRRRGSS
jgi:tetratricopeptide (TPR) repeat protein